MAKQFKQKGFVDFDGVQLKYVFNKKTASAFFRANFISVAPFMKFYTTMLFLSNFFTVKANKPLLKTIKN